MTFANGEGERWSTASRICRSSTRNPSPTAVDGVVPEATSAVGTGAAGHMDCSRASIPARSSKSAGRLESRCHRASESSGVSRGTAISRENNRWYVDSESTHARLAQIAELRIPHDVRQLLSPGRGAVQEIFGGSRKGMGCVWRLRFGEALIAQPLRTPSDPSSITSRLIAACACYIAHVFWRTAPFVAIFCLS